MNSLQALNPLGGQLGIPFGGSPITGGASSRLGIGLGGGYTPPLLGALAERQKLDSQKNMLQMMMLSLMAAASLNQGGAAGAAAGGKAAKKAAKANKAASIGGSSGGSSGGCASCGSH